jgi:RNA polymerase-interacting CarD/CdnL/TRCF family regulator
MNEMEQWWNDTDRVNPKDSERDLSQCQRRSLLEAVEQLQADEIEITGEAQEHEVRDVIINCSCEAAEVVV